LAHQTLTQLDERMRGALGNVQLKIMFGISRPDADILARHIFQVDGERIKHLVDDANQQERSHPVFYSLPEEWERATQRLLDLTGRHAFVKSAGRPAPRLIKTITIGTGHRDDLTLAAIKNRLGTRVALAVTELEKTVMRGTDTAKSAQKKWPQLRERITERPLA
jgi:hypothetical protein